MKVRILVLAVLALSFAVTAASAQEFVPIAGLGSSSSKAQNRIPASFRSWARFR